MDALFSDLRSTVRRWRRSPGSIAASAVALSLATAASTAVFSIVAGLVLRPLPYPDPSGLVMVWQDNSSRGGPARDWASPGLFVEWQRRATIFETLGAVRGWSPSLTEGDAPERLAGAAVSHGYFAALGHQPVLGRTFDEADDRAGGPPVAVISHGLWLRRFAADPRVLERPLSIDGVPTSILGVMPPGFRPAVVEADIWTPLRIDPAAAPRGMVVLRVLGRLRDGLRIEEAQAAISALASQLAAEDPEWERARTALVPLHHHVAGPARRPALLLAGAVTLVLLMAMANLAHLLLARGVESAREAAVRAALGAGRWAIVRPMVVESLALAALATAAGGVAGWWLLRLSVSAAPPAIGSALRDARLDPLVLAFTAAATCLVALVAVLPAAATALRGRFTDRLRAGRTDTGPGRRVHASLLVAEIAIAVVLVVGATLLTRSLVAALRVDLGFAPDHLLTAGVQPPRGLYRDGPAVRAFLTTLLERASHLPGVESAALTSLLPLGGGELRMNFGVDGRAPAARPEDEPIASMRQVSAGFFRTMRTRIVAGREFTPQDDQAAPAVVVVNETLARRYWPGGSAVGRRVLLDGDAATVVGVAADVHHAGPAAPPSAELYRPFLQAPPRAAVLVLRTSERPEAVVPPLRSALREIDRRVPLGAATPMAALVSQSVGQSRFLASVLGGFALTATMLALVGVYGVQSFLAGRRAREIGIRIALGAQPPAVVRLVLGQSLTSVLLGVAAGLGAAALLAAAARALLFGIAPTDPSSYVLSGLFIAVAAAAASYVPARRAAGLDPLSALRED